MDEYEGNSEQPVEDTKYANPSGDPYPYSIVVESNGNVIPGDLGHLETALTKAGYVFEHSLDVSSLEDLQNKESRGIRGFSTVRLPEGNNILADILRREDESFFRLMVRPWALDTLGEFAENYHPVLRNQKL